MRVVYRPTALRDLVAVRDGFGFDHPSAAERLHQSLLKACEGLADFPKAGRLAQHGPWRELVTVRPYVVIYRIRREDVLIIRVVHGARLR